MKAASSFEMKSKTMSASLVSILSVNYALQFRQTQLLFVKKKSDSAMSTFSLSEGEEVCVRNYGRFSNDNKCKIT